MCGEWGSAAVGESGGVQWVGRGGEGVEWVEGVECVESGRRSGVGGESEGEEWSGRGGSRVGRKGEECKRVRREQWKVIKSRQVRGRKRVQQYMYKTNICKGASD